MVLDRFILHLQRQRRAFFLTPLVPPFSLALLDILSNSEAYLNKPFNALAFLLFVTFGGYFISFFPFAIFGFPTAALLKRAGRKEWWAFGAAGLFIGTALSFFFSRMLLGGFDSFTLVGGCSAGFLTGLTYWFLAVPEEEETSD